MRCRIIPFVVVWLAAGASLAATGAACDAQLYHFFSNMSGCQSTAGGHCTAQTVCTGRGAQACDPSGHCRPGGYNSTCINGQCPNGLSCTMHGGQQRCLVSLAASNDPCSVDLECRSMQCDSGRCSPLPDGSACDADAQCELTSACINSACRPRVASGDSCSTSSQYQGDPCERGTSCYFGKCTKWYSLSAGSLVGPSAMLCASALTNAYGFCIEPANSSNGEACSQDADPYACECISTNTQSGILAGTPSNATNIMQVRAFVARPFSLLMQ